MYKLYSLIIFISLCSCLSSAGRSESLQTMSSEGKHSLLQTSSDSLYTLYINNISIIIDSDVGARICSFKLEGQELLSSQKVNRGNYGSTLWLSPEGKWKGRGVLDVSPYKVELSNGVDLSLRSQNDTLRGFAFFKQFHANLADTSVVIKYTITNISKDMQEVSPWEVTRVPLGGLAFIPKASPSDFPIANKMYPLLAIRDSIGFIWYPHDLSLSSSQKLFMDGGEGWVAYVYEKVIFIKTFPVIKSDQAAPAEKNVEVYVNKAYMELENQGVYEKLETGKSLLYEVKWYARRLPVGLNVETGNKALIEYVRRVIKY